MRSAVQEIYYLSQLAQAPPKDFRHWVASRGFSGIIPPTTAGGVKGLLLSYQVRDGEALVITRVDMFVSNHGVNTINPAQLAYPSDPTITAYWSINGQRIQTQTNTPILALGQGEQLKVFRSGDTANFHIGTTLATVPTTQPAIDWQFRFNGYLTSPDVAARLSEMQTETPVQKELLDNAYTPPPPDPPPVYTDPYGYVDPYGVGGYIAAREGSGGNNSI